MLVGPNKVITIAYQLFSLPQDQKGSEVVIEERNADDPIEFICGSGVVLPAIEEALKNQSIGFNTSITLYPENGYGLYNQNLLTWLDKSKFPQSMTLKLGMKFQTQGPTGDAMAVIVKEIKDDKVLIDGNHPLAGLILKFDVRLLRVREATAHELATGQVNPAHFH